MNKHLNYAILKNYEKKKILVTGGAGFVGSNLVKELIQLGADVTVLDDLFTGSLDHLKGVNGYHFIKGDVRDEKLIPETVGEFEYVFHLAARNIIISLKNPKEDYSVNIGGTLNLLMALRDSKNLRKLIYSSSVSIYGNPRYLPINEDDPISLLNPYATSKFAGENYTVVFYENFNLPVTVVRYSNVYGDFQSPRNPYCGVVGKFIEKISRGQVPEIHGDGAQTRDFTYIKDAVEATLLAGILERSMGEIFNVGTGVETSINYLTEVLLDIYDKKELKLKYIDKRDIDNIRRRVVNIEKIRQKLKWFPQYNLKRGLMNTVEWYEKHKAGEK
ncbi:MAG: NAD-dependent epimerase/dehydratase family protein [bacterium]|nr:NAD-dependent epimerase/dehydratase family protein [bacterium]